MTTYKDFDKQLKVAFDSENTSMLLAVLRDIYIESDDLDAGLLFAIKSMMCSEGYFEEAEEILVELLNTELEKFASIWAMYMHTRMFSIVKDALISVLTSLHKFRECSVCNYILAYYYHIYEDNTDLTEHHIKASLDIDEYPYNLVFFARTMCKTKQCKEKYLKMAIDKVERINIEYEPFPNSIKEYLIFYERELLRGLVMTSSNWRIINEEYEQLRTGSSFVQKIKKLSRRIKILGGRN